MQIPASLLVEIIGVKKVVAVFTIFTTITTLLSPIGTRLLDFWGLLILRFCVGLGSAGYFPAPTALWSSWAPKNERSILTSIMFAGITIGNVFTFIISGYLCKIFGWDSIFYFSGGGVYYMDNSLGITCL